MTRGFLTMVFDFCQEGHFELLERCKARCDYLIVGLTTDARATAEKRVPIMTYSQRRAILKNCRFVDEVLPNHGASKEEMYEKLKFDILFSGDDYFDSDEFTSFRKAYPDVPVLFFPRTDLSSTALLEAMWNRFYTSQKIIATSITGYITKQGFGKPFHIIKHLHYSDVESTNEYASGDVFGFYRFFDELPRNWKRKDNAAQFPMISGVHANRELLINRKLKDEPWCTYISDFVVLDSLIATLPRHLHPPSEQKTTFATLYDFAEYVAEKRKKPEKIVQIVQREAGSTLEEWCIKYCSGKEQLCEKLKYVTDVIIPELERRGIVHGDLHPRNILVSKKGQVSAIDFGWVSSLSFDLEQRERAKVIDMLDHHFDLHHFLDSLDLVPAITNLIDVHAFKDATLKEKVIFFV